MLEPPTRPEWLFVYAPLVLPLAVALGVETATRRVPKWLTLATLAYLLGARLAFGPAGAGWYVLSLFIGAVVTIGFAWRKGYMGGGFVKMAIAASAAFPPILAMLFTGLIVLGCLLFLWTARWHGRKTMWGSLFLLTAVLVVLGITHVAAAMR